MKTGFRQNLAVARFGSRKVFAQITGIILFLLLSIQVKAVTKTSTATGNWSNPAVWSPAGIPASTDDVIIHGGNVITIDGTDTCHNLTLGDATSTNTTLQITSASNSLIINGNLSINPSNLAKIYTLTAGPGTINIAGTFSTWSSTGTNTIQVSTGTLTFAPAISISSANQNITFTAAGTVTFNNSFTDSYNKLVTFTGCTVNFAASYTVNTTSASWAGKGTANFTGNGSTIIATSNLTLFNVQIAASTSVALASAAGTAIIGGAFTLSSGSTFTPNQAFELDGNWVNNGGTIASNSSPIMFNGSGQTISGTSATSFDTLQIGSSNSAVTVACTMNFNTACSALIFNSFTKARTLTISAGDTLRVNGNATINQGTAAVTNSLAVNTGTCIISGTLNLPGTTTTASYIAKAVVTTGSLTVSGGAVFGNNTTAANTLITASTGTVTLGSTTMASGTLSLTGAGTINFNGTTAPSFNFGGSNAPVFTTTAGCTLNFTTGFTNNTTVLTLNATSNSYFVGNGSIIPNANITFGNIQINATDTVKAATGYAKAAGIFTLGSGSVFTPNQSFEVDGNWVNSGGTISNPSSPIMLNGAAQTIGGVYSTTFDTLQIGSSNSAVTVACTMNINTACSGLVFNGYTNARTLTITGGDTLKVNGNVTINQGTAAVTNTLAVNTATCIISGTLNLPGTTTTGSYIVKAAVTTGSLTATGGAVFGNNATAANAVITASTGTITLGSTTMASGTLSLTGAGTINFNGTSAPSFNFGGTYAPVFTTTAGCTLNFTTGFTNNTTALVLNATSNSYFNGNGSITPNANITFGNIQINAADTVKAAAGYAKAAGIFTLGSGSVFTPTQGFELDGNWVNSGGTISNPSSPIMLNGAAQTIGGSYSTTFDTLQIGCSNSAVTVACTMNINTACSALVFNGYTNARTLTITGGDTLTVNGNATINQGTAAVTNSLAINTGTCIISGTLNLPGTTTTGNYIAKAAVTTGSLTVSGGAVFGSNTTAANAVITASTGTITLGSTTMASGTLSLTGAGTINFNGTTAPSFNFGGSNAPVFTTFAACTLNFTTGFTNNTTALVLNATSNSYFIGNGSITPNANITFGNMQINAADTVKAAAGYAKAAGIFTLGSISVFTPNQGFEVDGNWVNSGGTISNPSSPIMMNGAAQTIGGGYPTTFDTLQIGSSNSAVTVACTMNINTACSALVFNGYTNARTLTITGGDTLRVNGNATINQGTAAVTNTLAVNTGTCIISGTLNLPGTITTASYIAKAAVTTGSLTASGGAVFGNNSTVANAVITASTGTITIGSTTMVSGTLSLTGAGTINFNGTTAPSFNFGGSNAPVFTTFAACTLNFTTGFTNNTTALTLNATSNTYFTGNGSITPNANITFGNVQLNAADTVKAATGYAKAAGIFTLGSGSVFTPNQSFEADGNWVNDGGTITNLSRPVMLNGAAQTIGGTSSTTFDTLQIGSSNSAVTVACTMNINTACSALVFNGYTNARTLTIAGGDTLTVNGNATINQGTAAVTNNLAVGAGTCIVSGNLIFVGTTNTATWIAEVSVTSGAFTLNGTVTWMSNTAVATEVITVSTGTINFAQSLTMGTGTGTLSATGAGTINFNGATAPSFAFGGAATSPVFTAGAGCNLYFNAGFTNSTNALTLNAASNAYFTGNNSITPNAAITFGNIQINSPAILTLAGNISVQGNWTDYSTFTAGTNTVTFNAASPNIQTIANSGGETFYNLIASNAGATLLLADLS